MIESVKNWLQSRVKFWCSDNDYWEKDKITMIDDKTYIDDKHHINDHKTHFPFVLYNDAVSAIDESVSIEQDKIKKQCELGIMSDGFHTFNELYEYRKIYNAAFFNSIVGKYDVIKSKRHYTGELCFGGGWFIVIAQLPSGQISNHYELKDWDLFKIPEKQYAYEWDGHTPEDAKRRLIEFIKKYQ